MIAAARQSQRQRLGLAAPALLALACGGAREPLGLHGPVDLRDSPSPREAGRAGESARHMAPAEGAGLARELARLEARRTASGFDSERLWSLENDWEPSVAVAPDSGIVFQLTTRYSPSRALPAGPDPALILRRSLDRGASWQPDQLVHLAPTTQNDPQLAACAGGLVLAAWMSGWEILVARSSDSGASWSAPVPVLSEGAPPSWADKPILLASRDGRDVYVAFNASDSYVAVSHDGGRSFGAPLLTQADGDYCFHTGGAIAADGSVGFAATVYRQDAQGPVRIELVRSIDKGRSWTTTSVERSAQGPPCEAGADCPTSFLGPSASLAVDAAGAWLLAFNASPREQAAARLFVRRSSDCRAFDERVEVGSLDPLVRHAFPALASGPAPGDFRLVWQDERTGQGRWNSWFRRSTDGGRSWSPARRLSDLARGVGYKHELGFDFPYGDYLGLCVDGEGQNHVIWGEGAGYGGPGGSWYTRGE